MMWYNQWPAQTWATLYGDGVYATPRVECTRGVRGRLSPHCNAMGAPCYNLGGVGTEVGARYIKKSASPGDTNTRREPLASFSAEFGSRRTSSLDLAL